MLRLRAKYFAVILAVNVALAGGLYLFLTYSFEKDFTNYVSRREREFSESLAIDLEAYYQTHGSWRAFAQQPMLWRTFVWRHARLYRHNSADNSNAESSPRSGERIVNDESLDSATLSSSRTGERRFERRRSPPQLMPLFLLDGARNPVAGARWPEEDSLMRPLRVDNQVVGFIGVPISPEMRDYLDRQFASSQSHNLAVIIIATLLVALLAAIPLSHLMVKRISALVRHVQNLSLGRYREPLVLAGKDELNVLANHLTDLGTTLAKSEQQRNAWVADISHELRTPVAILQADLEALEDGVRNLDAAAIARLQQHVARLKRLIEDLHDLSLTDLGSLTYRKASCDLQDLASEAAELMQDQFSRRGLEFSFEQQSDKALPLLADNQRLLQLLLNLLHNSLNYTDVPGRVVLRLYQEGEEAVLRIEDSAPGVSQELQPKLTERLFRVESSRNRNSGGAGLGLTLCANIAAAHGGSLAFDDSPLGGLRVSLRLPLAPGNTSKA